MSVENPKEWRLDFAGHLKGLQFQFRCYDPASENNDHDHCAACWAKFAEFEGPDIQHKGYATWYDYEFGAAYVWVCCECFNDLQSDMEWNVSPESI